MIKLISYVLVIVGLFMVIGAAGSDCDGACIDNAFSFSELLKYVSIGTMVTITGIIGVVKTS